MCNHYQATPEAIPGWAEWAGFRLNDRCDQAAEHVWPKRVGLIARTDPRTDQAAGIIEPMNWGVPMTIPGKRPGTTLIKHVTNVRNLASPFWKSMLSHPAQRCLVPFTRFAEPKPGKDPQTGRPAEYWFSVNEAPVAAFAGIWRPSEEGNVFAFLTCEPNSLVAPLHPKAMPVILMLEDYEQWLTASYEEACALASPFPSQLMAIA